MNEQWLEILRCPEDASRLRWFTSASKHELVCESCSARFPFVDGILRFISNEAQEISGSVEKAQEMKARDEFAHRYAGHFSRITNLIEIPPYLKALHANPRDKVIELGCGTGRVTREYVANVDSVVALDFSLESLKLFRNQISKELHKKILFVQADMSKLPFGSKAFDKVVSFQVIEHLPSNECRKQAIGEAARVLKDNGKIICSLFNYSQLKKNQGMAKEGFHQQNGKPIYFFNSEPRDLRELLNQGGFRIDSLKGLSMQVRGKRFISYLAIPLDRFLSSIPFGFRYAHLLFATGYKNPMS